MAEKRRGDGFCDSETCDSISHKPSVRTLQGSFLSVSFTLATQAPRNLAKMFRRESLVEICHSPIRDFHGGGDVKVFFFKTSGGWVNLKLKLPHFRVSDTCRFNFTPTLPLQEQLALRFT